MWLIREISLPHWAQHRLRTILVVATVAAGVAGVTATLSVSQSVLAAFDHMSDVTSAHADVFVLDSGAGVPDALIETIRQTRGIEDVSAFVSGFVALAQDPRTTLSVLGFDLFADTDTLQRVPRSAVHVPNRERFLLDPRSIAVSRRLAAATGVSAGDKLDVLAPRGKVSLTIGGMIDDVGPVALFDGRVAVMDLPAAQHLLARDGLVDRIDVRLRPDTTVEAAIERLDAVTMGRARVVPAAYRTNRGRELLRSLRIVLALVGAISVVVGFFIVIHAMNVSFVQRRYEVGVLATFGVAPSRLLGWILIESLCLGGIAVVIGIAGGLLLAHMAVGLYGAVSSVWVAVSPATLQVQAGTLALAAFVGIGATGLATWLAARSALSEPSVHLLRQRASGPAGRASVRRILLRGVAVLAVAGAAARFAPSNLPYEIVVLYILGVNCAVLIGFGLLSPLAGALLARLGSEIGARSRGLVCLLGFSDTRRNPAAPVAVVTAIVLALGWTLANAAMIASFKDSWMGWVHRHYHSDLTVTAANEVTSILTARPFDEAVVDEIARMAGVRDTQGLRRVETRLADHPAMLIAFDETTRSLPTLDVAWENVADAFWAGEGVLISESARFLSGIEPGRSLELSTPSGRRSFPVLAAFRDVFGGDLGAIAISRETYKALWDDRTVDRVRVWTDGDSREVAGAINAHFTRSHGIEAVSYEATMAALRALIDDAFSLTYALVFVCLVTSGVGVLNFLLGRVLEREREWAILSAVGTTPRQVVSSLLVEALAIGVTGIAIGLIAGTLVSVIVVFRSVPMVNGWRFDYTFPGHMIVAIVAAVLAAAFAAALFPSRLAIRPSFLRGRVE